MKKSYFILAILFLTLGVAVSAQTTSFVFQGKLQDGGIAANGTYQFQFKLFDAATGGNQIGQTIPDIPATVTNGIFAVNLDFGAGAFDGAARYIEVGVRLNGSGQNYTILNPRQAVTSTPYAVKSMKAERAIVADDALSLGGVAASQYVITNDARLSDDRNPLPDSPNYIQNATTTQANSNFSISGEGRANILSANLQFNLGGSRVLHQTGSFNTFVGFESGNSIAGGNSNSFFGIFSGKKTTTGSNNSFFGSLAGSANIAGSENSFFGQGAGLGNTSGAGNSLFGYGAGLNNTTGTNNTFVGFVAGQSNTTESYNTFLGYRANGAAGITNATAIGANAVVATSNTMVLGTNLVTVQVPGNLSVANTFSAAALNSATVYKINDNRVFHLTGTDNTFVGLESGNSITTGGFNAFFGSNAGKGTTTGLNNAFFGAYAGRDNTTGGNNAFFGANAGLSNNSSFNAFFGSGSGFANLSGANNSYFGFGTGANNTTGDNNSFFGSNAGKTTGNSSFNSFFGSFAGEKTTTGAGNTFVGAFAGRDNQIGFNNTFIGYKAGQTPTTGNGNIVIGYNASVASGVSNSIVVGAGAVGAQSNQIVFGNFDTLSIKAFGDMKLIGDLDAGAGSFRGLDTTGQVNLSNILNVVPSPDGIEQHKVLIGGELSVTSLKAAGGVISGTLQANQIRLRVLNQGGTDNVCFFNETIDGLVFHRLALCSSSRRYKDDIQNYAGGLNVLNRLRPVTFRWKSNGQQDLGFVAEEVNEIEPLLNNFNDRGEIEGVKYAQITTVLVNSVKEQQAQIESQAAENQNLQAQLKRQQAQLNEQQAQIDALRALVCQSNPNAAVCVAPQEK